MLGRKIWGGRQHKSQGSDETVEYGELAIGEAKSLDLDCGGRVMWVLHYLIRIEGLSCGLPGPLSSPTSVSLRNPSISHDL